jgi:MYXO-CTERM domain-containing protein
LINTAAQLGTAIGVALVILIAAITTGTPDTNTPAPTIAWGTSAALAALGAAGFFARRSPTEQDPQG